MSLIFDTLPIKRLEADLPEVESRTASSHTASWMRVKHRFPGVVSPVFHATTGPRAARIALYGEGIKADSGYSNFGGQEGVSVSRDLSFLLKGGFGNVIFVLDYQSLRNHFDVEPVQYPGIGDEFEERVYTDLIPVAMIRGVIFNAHLSRPNAQEWLETVPYPVVYRAKDGSWVQLGTSITATLSQPEKEDREAERLVKPAPQKKPPRTDLRRTHIEDRDTREDDADIKQDKKDQSRNYKDAAIRVAERHLLAGGAPETHGDSEKIPVLNEKGRKVWVNKKILENPDLAAKYRPYKKKDEGAAASDAPPKDTEPKVPKVPNVPNVDEHGDAVDHIAQIRSAFPDPRYSKIFDNIPEQEHESFKNLFDAEAATIGDLPRDDLEKAVSDAEMYVRGAKGPTDVKAFAKALAAIQQAREVTGGAEAVDAQTEKLISTQDFDEERDGLAIMKKLSTFNLLQQHSFNAELESQLQTTLSEARKGLQNESDGRRFKSQVEDARTYFSAKKEINPKDAARHAAVLLANHAANDPMVQFGINDASMDPIPSDMEGEAAVQDEIDALAAYLQVKKSALDGDALKDFIQRLGRRITTLPENSPAQRKAAAVVSALKIRQIAISPANQEVKGMSLAFANGIRAAALNGEETWFLETSGDAGKSATQILGDISAKIGSVYGGLTNSELLDFLPEKMPLRELARDTFQNTNSPAAHRFVRESVILALQGQAQFTNVVDPEFVAEHQQAASVLEEEIEDVRARKNWFNFKDSFKKITDSVAAFLKRLAELFKKSKNKSKSWLQALVLTGLIHISEPSPKPRHHLDKAIPEISGIAPRG